jgi:transposase
MTYTQIAIERAKRMEQLVERVEAGEPLEEVCLELDLRVSAARYPWWRARYEAGSQSWEALIDGRRGQPKKVHSAIKEWLYERKRQDASLTAVQLAEAIHKQFGVELSDGHINHLLRQVGLTRPPGRPARMRSERAKPEVPAEEPAEEEQIGQDAAEQEENLEQAGLFFPGGRKAGHGPDTGSDPGADRGS